MAIRAFSVTLIGVFIQSILDTHAGSMKATASQCCNASGRINQYAFRGSQTSIHN